MPPRLRSFEFAPALLERMQAQFPRRCASCGRVYESFADYAERTTPLGTPQDLDADERVSDPTPPLGLICYANCGCGSTLALSCDLPKETRQSLRQAIKPDATAMGWRDSQVWRALRAYVHELGRRKGKK